MEHRQTDISPLGTRSHRATHGRVDLRMLRTHPRGRQPRRNWISDRLGLVLQPHRGQLSSELVLRHLCQQVREHSSYRTAPGAQAVGSAIARRLEHFALPRRYTLQDVRPAVQHAVPAVSCPALSHLPDAHDSKTGTWRATGVDERQLAGIPDRAVVSASGSLGRGCGRLSRVDLSRVLLP